MKISIVVLAVVSGYFLLAHAFSTLVFLACIAAAFWFGFYLPDIMNANNLSDRWDRVKPTSSSKLSIYRPNTLSLWIGVYLFLAAISSVVKGIVVNWKVNQLAIMILALSIATFIRLNNGKLTVKNH